MLRVSGFGAVPRASADSSQEHAMWEQVPSSDPLLMPIVVQQTAPFVPVAAQICNGRVLVPGLSRTWTPLPSGACTDFPKSALPAPPSKRRFRLQNARLPICRSAEGRLKQLERWSARRLESRHAQVETTEAAQREDDQPSPSFLLQDAESLPKLPALKRRKDEDEDEDEEEEEEEEDARRRCSRGPRLN